MFRPALRRSATVLALVVVLQVLRWATWEPLRATRAGTASLDDLVGLAAAAGCWVLVGWVMLVLALTAVAAIPGAMGRIAADVASRLAPMAVRRTARLAVGLAVAAGTVAAAAPAGADPAAASFVATGDAPAVALLPDVGRPGWSAAPTSAPPRGSPPSQDGVRTVQVSRGDCLWTITGAALGPAATDAEIAAEWPRWYAANRAVIGADPNLILPGMVLRVPAPR